MSSIIDDFINIDIKTYEKYEAASKKSYLVYGLSKKLNNSYACFIYTNSLQTEVCTTKIANQDKEYIMQMINQRSLGSLSILFHELADNRFKKISSKSLQISLLSMLARIQYLQRREFILYLQQGRLSMKLKITYIPSYRDQKKQIDIFKKAILRNIVEFQNTLTSYFKESKDLIGQYQKQDELFKDLSACLILNKTTSNFDYTPDKVNLKINANALKRQKMEIKKIEDGIISQRLLEKSIDLYYLRYKVCNSQWLKDNLRDISQSHTRKYKNSWEILGLEQRKKVEANLKILKIELKEQSKKPLAEGGSCLIYYAKMMISFVNNEDRLQGKFDEKIEKMQKTLAIKQLKPQYEKIFKEKLEHQKQIVTKFQYQSSYFIPKYYTTQRQSQLSHGLVMQLINGQQLDSFLRARNLTISFRTKIYILLNIFFSMRPLIFNQIVHLDMKPINIMVCKQLITKIIDFGQSYHKDVCQKHYTPGFTFPYVAPQVYAKYQNQLMHKKRQDMEYTEKQDAFAFGMIMYEVFFNCRPFNLSIQKYKEVYYEKKISERLFVTPQLLESYENYYLMSALMHNIEKCLNVEPENRPRFDWMGIMFKIILNFLKNH